MNIGQLNKRLALYPPAETQNSVGEPIVTYPTAEATVWGSLVPLSGRELEHAKQISAEISYESVIRYYPLLTTQYRIYAKSRWFEIAAALNHKEGNEFQTLMLKEIQ